MRTSNKRLIANIDEELHYRIKMAALCKNISMTKYIMQAIIASLIKDEIQK